MFKYLKGLIRPTFTIYIPIDILYSNLGRLDWYPNNFSNISLSRLS